MVVGHINLATSMNGTGEHFIKLVEALDGRGIDQHVLVANHALARRISIYDHVAGGPVVKTPVMAYCLMPEVNVVHAHGRNGGQAGLLMTLTRSTPYVLTRRSLTPVGKNPISRSIISRAASVICPSREAAARLGEEAFETPVEIIEDISHESIHSDRPDNQIAVEHLRVYRQAVESWRAPVVLI